MAKKIYKQGGVVIILDTVTNDIQAIASNSLDFRVSGSIFYLRDGIENTSINLGTYDNILDENDTAFVSNAEFITYITSLIDSGNSSPLKASINRIADTYNNTIDVQNPLQVDSDSVHFADIDIERSSIVGFSGNILSLFDNLHTEIVNADEELNPKTVLVHFKRTVQAFFIGLGSSEGGNFSNVKIIGLLSGMSETVLFDGSGDSTEKTSQKFNIQNSDLNALRIEFHTTYPISLTNLFIPKIQPVISINKSATKFATAYNSPYLLNTGSQDMNVNGSVTPVVFSYTALNEVETWQRSFIDLQDGIQDFQPTQFGALSALINGVQVAVIKNGVETVIETWRTNMDISMTMFDFQSNYKAGAYIGRWTITSDMGTPITLFKGDSIIIRINDNLSTLDAFRFRLKISK